MSAAAATGATLYDRQMKWKRHGQKRLAFESQRLENAKLDECTFSPQTNKRDVKRVIELSKLSTKSEAHAMQIHVARQQKARQPSPSVVIHLQPSGSSGKNYDQVTECKPFRLSQGNKTRREAVPVPRPRAHSESPKKSTGGGSNQPLPLPQTSNNHQNHSRQALDKQVQDAIDNNKSSSDNEESHASLSSWEKERKTLIGIIEAQRHELKAREKGQDEATKVADKFATAVLAFEERLLAVEQKSKSEMVEMRKAMDRQQAHIMLLLQALGISADEKETRLLRKESEKSNV
ncbi:hypothetical protein AC1031_008269 [Aphanomyces cochlioides]|nr:hypothetical protein AC1031_008269 [Aphanomyces cochlioides]